MTTQEQLKYDKKRDRFWRKTFNALLKQGNDVYFSRMNADKALTYYESMYRKL